MNWKSRAEMERLRRRAAILAAIRARFAQQGVLEVETPVLAQSSCLDPQVPSLELPLAEQDSRWLQTSPENHMKRLLAAGSGPIYRLGPVFRAGEMGRWHGPEFTLLEWYRPGFDDIALMVDVAGLMEHLGGPKRCRMSTFAELLQSQAGLDLHQSPTEEVASWCEERGLKDASTQSRDTLLDYIMGVHIGPKLGRDGLQFVTEFPASQAALARLDGQDPRVARRFELYWRGLELANGFHELGDAAEQSARFEQEQAQREADGLAAIPTDQRLLAALEAGLPDCAGVALGVDRLVALLTGAESVAETQCFPWDDA